MLPKLFISQFNQLFLQLSKLLKMKSYFLQFLISLLIVALALPLTSSKFFKLLNLNPIVALSLFKLLPTTQLSFHQDILATLKSPLLILNHHTKKLRMLTLQYTLSFIHIAQISLNQNLPFVVPLFKKLILKSKTYNLLNI